MINLFQPSSYSSMRPPRVRVITFFSCNCCITVWDSGSIGLYLVWQTRPPQFSLICSHVRQFENLRPASFRFHVTMDTSLPFGNSSYYQACIGLSPPSYHQCRAHHKKPQESKNSLEVFLLVFYIK